MSTSIFRDTRNSILNTKPSDSNVFVDSQQQNEEENVENLCSRAFLCQEQGKFEEAEFLFRQAIASYERAFGEQHPNYAVSLYILAILYQDQGRFSEAESLLRQALAITKQALGENHPDYANSVFSLAVLCARQGKSQEAESLFHQALVIDKKALADKDSNQAC